MANRKPRSKSIHKPKGHYVYKVLVEGVCRYVGSGRGARYLHGNSGKSSCIELNQALFEGKNLKVEIIIDSLSKDQSIIEETKLIMSVGIDTLFNKALPFKGLRLLEGKSTNSITTYELVTLLDHYFENGYNSESINSAFEFVYNNTDHINKEVDWIDKIKYTRYVTKKLNTAIHLSNHPLVIKVRTEAEVIATPKKSLIKVMKEMGNTLIKLDDDFKKDEDLRVALLKIKELEEALIGNTISKGVSNWKEEAKVLLSKDYTQKQIADIVGKSVATIERLVKWLKKEEVEEIYTTTED